MSNIKPPAKNNLPTSSGYPGGLRPPPQRGLNSWSGPTWSDRVNPTRVNPPTTSPFSRLPPKLPPAPKGPGLGLLTRLKPNIPGLLLVGGLLLLDWWLNQPSPPPDTLPPPPPSFDTTNLPLGEYRVWYQAESFSGGIIYESYFITSGAFSVIYEDDVIPGQIWSYYVNKTAISPQQQIIQVRQDFDVGPYGLWATEVPLNTITNAVGLLNIKRNSIRITKIENLTTNQTVPPIVITNNFWTPPYTLAPKPGNDPR